MREARDDVARMRPHILHLAWWCRASLVFALAPMASPAVDQGWACPAQRSAAEAQRWQYRWEGAMNIVFSYCGEA